MQEQQQYSREEKAYSLPLFKDQNNNQGYQYGGRHCEHNQVPVHREPGLERNASTSRLLY